MKDQSEIETRIKERLDEIKAVPARNPRAVSSGRARFLSQAVSASEFQRHKGWKSIFRKEQFAMNAIVSILVIAGLLFGGGATVNAAQNDLPNEPLYAVKMWSEDISLQFQNNQEEKVYRLMDLAQTRLQEMTQLTDAGQPIPDQVRERLEQHIQQALQICSQLDDPALDQTLLQLRDKLQQQDRDVEQLQIQTQDQLQIHTQDQQQLLKQTRTMLHDRLQLVEDGLLNHEMFREQVRNGFQSGQDDELTPPVQNGDNAPAITPNGPNTDPGGPNTDPGGSNTDPGGTNADPGGPNTDPGGPGSGGNDNGSGGGSGGNGSGGNG